MRYALQVDFNRLSSSLSIDFFYEFSFMKYLKLGIAAGLICLSLTSCKTLAKGAAKWWTKKQIKEFVNNCEEKTSRLLGDEQAAKYCDCAVDKVAEEYKNFDEIKEKGILTVLKIAADCK